MELAIECFKNVTAENVHCIHSKCYLTHVNIFPHNDTCGHGNLEDVADVKEIQTWIMEKDLDEKELNALLSGVVVLGGCCICQFSWDIDNFFGDLLAYTSDEKFEIIISNWFVKYYLNELRGIWSREEIINTRLKDLALKGERTRIRRVISILTNVYHYVYGDYVPFVFDIHY